MTLPPPPNESEVEKTAKFTRKLLKGIVVVAIIVVVVVIAGLAYNTYFSRINQVQIRVQYSGSWSGAYSNGGALNMNTFSGSGEKTVILDRPSQSGVWAVSADAMKTDGSSDMLTLSILKMDGTVLQTSSSSYGFALVSDNLGS